jgi:uncharacterized membrane protein YccC
MQTAQQAPLRSVLAGIPRFDREGFQLARGVRYALGVGAPLFVGVATSHTLEGIAVAGGGTLIGLTDSGSPYRQRTRTMLIAAVGAAISTFIGAVTGADNVIAVLLLALWSFGAGMFISLGLPAYFVALMSPLSMVVIAAYPADAAHSAERAGLVFVGGLIQIALVLVLWRVHAHRPERAAVAKLYRAIAAWTREDEEDAAHRVTVLAALSAARRTLAATEGRLAAPSPAGEAFRLLVGQADRTYIDTVALKDAHAELAAADDSAAAPLALARAAAADVLAAVADALDSGHWRADAAALRSQIDAAVDALQAELERQRSAGETEVADQLEAWLKRAASVRSQLRAAVDLAVPWQGEGMPPDDPLRHARARPPELRTRGTRAILRANLTLRSSAFRHAVRLAVTTAVAAALYRALGLPHGYWVPLTVLFILRPDFGSTFTRGLQRYIGTAAGVVFSTLLAAAVHLGPYALASIATVLALGMFAFILANYALFTMSVTAFIVFLSSFGGSPEYATALHRLVASVIGATLTLVFYALWPTWERETLPDTTAELIDADRAFLRAVLACWLDPAGGDREQMRAARPRARVARTNTEAAVQRALGEPKGKRPGLPAAEAAAVLASLRRLADGALTLEAYLDDDVPAAPAQAAVLADQLDTALTELARAARECRAPSPLPPLVETQQTLSEQIGRTTPLAEETDRIVASVMTVDGILAQREPRAAISNRVPSRTGTALSATEEAV